VRWLVGQPLGNISAYFNRLARAATGSHFLILNDDAFLDATLPLEAILALPPGHYGRTCPLGLGGSYSEFPVLTREGLDRLGWLMPESFPGWGADEYCYRVYEAAGLVVDLPVVLQHERELHGQEFQRMACLSGRYDAKGDVSGWVKRLNP